MRHDLFLGVLLGGFRLLMARIIWQAVYAGRAEIGGMSLAQTTSFYLIVSFIRQIDQSEGYVWEFAAEIRNGSFGKYLVRPVDPLGYFLSVCSGRGLFHSAIAALAAGAWALPFLPALAPLSAVGALAALPVLLLGYLALALLNYLTALLAFAVQDILPYHMAKNALIELLSGALVPVAFFPGWARAALEATPFPAMASLPATLMLGLGSDGYGKAMGALLCWNAALLLSARLAYAKLSAAYEEAGA